MTTAPKLAAIKQYMRHLTTPSNSPRLIAAEPLATGQTAELTTYIYQFNASDLAYSTSQYPVSGNFSGTTSPWFNNIETIPATWQWTTADSAAATARSAQVTSENAYIQQNVPGQTYSGTASAQIQQRYTLGMWDNTVFSQSQINTLTENWVNDDAEFARQRLGGANPDVIAKYSGSNADLATWVDGGAGSYNNSALVTALQAANTAGTLFVCDYTPALGKVKNNQFVQNGFYFSVPVAFFSVVGQTLMPLAIQVDSSNKGYIFTPQDDANSWLLAKLWGASADAQWWYSGTHLFNTHSIAMIFSTSALNLIEQGLLAQEHPIMVLMYPHIQKVFNINNAVYNVAATSSIDYGIYQTGSFCDQFLPTGRIGIYQIINDLYQNYNFDDMAFDRTLATRKVDSGNLPVSFPYRDDGQIWWQAIQSFVGNVVDATYSNDAAVAADTQLNAWMNMTQGAFNHDGVKRYTWTASKSYLKQAMTNLFFLASVQHTAVNDSMLQSWGFVPNGAFAMTSAPPVKAGVTDAELLAALPDPQVKANDGYAWPIQNQINFVMNGTAQVGDIAAGDGTAASVYAIYPYNQTSQPSQYQAVTDFYNALWTGSSSVKEQVTGNQNKRIADFQKSYGSATTVPYSVSYYYLSVATQTGMDLNAPVMNCIQI